ncbi:sodium:proton antiporter [Leucobacter weissii]|uniref:sodium:proton antiporter n=1 Tax=Leucobacter weissii TaxID=1983706 RepID=UPI001FB66A7F|nr:sodium:proton antiporter [Leucobacter weissii]
MNDPVTFHSLVTIAVIAGLTATALCAVVRIVRGPTILDRMIAGDVLLTTLMLTVGSDMVLRGHTDGIALMTVIAATAVLATVVVARYVRRRARLPEPDDGVVLPGDREARNRSTPPGGGEARSQSGRGGSRA